MHPKLLYFALLQYSNTIQKICNTHNVCQLAESDALAVNKSIEPSSMP